ncbi:MAG TPA: hypothetical protein VF233_09820 [Nitrososphaeraceae archaeon]
MKNTNTTLAMVAVLAVVTMLSAGLAVPMQQAIAEDGGRDGDSGGNNFEADIDQEQECERAGCDQSVTITNDQRIREMETGPVGNLLE